MGLHTGTVHFAYKLLIAEGTSGTVLDSCVFLELAESESAVEIFAGSVFGAFGPLIAN